MHTYELVVDINDFDSDALVFDDALLIEQDIMSDRYVRLVYVYDIAVSDDILEVEGVCSVIEDGHLVYSVFKGE